MSEYVDDANYELSLAEIFLNTLLDNEKVEVDFGVETNGPRAAFIEKESAKAESSWWKKFWNWLISN